MFYLESKKLTLKLEIVPVSSLMPHENIIPHKVKELMIEFKNWASLQCPIIVDENNIVLDGNHRAHVFKLLNFKYIPVCKLDYFNDQVELRYWFRLFKKSKNIGLLKETITSLGGQCVLVEDLKILKKKLEKKILCWGVVENQHLFSVDFPEKIVFDAVSAYENLQKVQDILLKNGLSMEYIPCQYTGKESLCFEIEKDQKIIFTPQITKKMIVKATKKGQVFSPKTTRHLIPSRPININVPSFWFHEDISLEVINDRFNRLLKNRNVQRFGPGQVIDGRYYEEELFVFY